MPFQITTTHQFSAAHQLVLYDGMLEPLHGHNWQVRVTASAPKLDAIGVVMDFHELERLIDAILAPLHNQHLNTLEVFDPKNGGLNPSAENVALHIGHALRLPGHVKLECVEVWETPQNSALYRP